VVPTSELLRISHLQPGSLPGDFALVQSETGIAQRLESSLDDTVWSLLKGLITENDASLRLTRSLR
jgi:hypothetical protein